MRHVARAASVAVSTVSKALRNDPSIPEKRCRAIKAIADRLGYRPHPLVATLMSQMHHRRRRSDPHHLVWLDLWPWGQERSVATNAALPLLGAQERARELGYGIEVYRPGAEELSPASLRHTLTARGQWGVIIPPVHESAMKLNLDLRGLAGVTIGTSLAEPVMHRVSLHHFQGCVLAFEQLRAKGFRRVGLLLTTAMNSRVQGKWLGAFLACQQSLPKSERVPPLLTEDDDVIIAWLGRQKPDAVLVAETFACLTVDSSKQNAATRPLVVWLMQQAPCPGFGGLDLRLEQLGRVAVELVVAQIHRNERGSPTTPHTVLIDAGWIDSEAPHCRVGQCDIPNV